MVDEGRGLERRKQKRRTSVERAAIVAQTYEAGVTVAEVARRHGIVASQLSSWRTAARRKANWSTDTPPEFARVSVVSDDALQAFDGVEIVCGAVSVRLPGRTTSKRIADIAQRLVQAR